MAKIDLTKIVSEKEDSSTNTKSYILKNGTFLAEILEELPNGIINKNITGIGATSLELECNRHSLIVEPLKVTASSKAASKKGCLYIGSPTSFHPKKVNPSDIESYIKDPSIKFKKIFCVIDSLSKVTKYLEKFGFEDYFLCLDESDSLQIESSFRQKAMEKAIQIYKNHNKDKRCLISATPLKFNDPSLVKENITTFDYNKKENVKANIIRLSNLEDCIVEKTQKLLADFPEQKIVIAFNNIDKNIYIADQIEKLGVNKDEIKILCSKSSKKRAGSYYSELSSDHLPGKVNLKTSAYFTGFDLNERYHLIIAIDTTDVLNMPSERRIKQIAGRCRVKPDGLYSLNLAFNDIKEVEIPTYDLKKLEEDASKEVNALNCISTMFDSGSTFYSQVKSLRSLLVKSIKINGYSIVYEDSITKDAHISYLGIDAALEIKRTIGEMYCKRGLFEKNLVKEGYILSYEECSIKGKSGSSVIKSRLRLESIEFIERNLKDVLKGGSLLLERIYNSNLNSFERQIFDTYDDFADYIDKESLVNELIKISKNYSSQKLNNFRVSANFIILEDSSSFKQALMKFFPIGSKMTIEQRDKNMIKVLQKLGLGISNEDVDSKKISYIFNRALKYTKGADPENGATTFKIQNYNPLDLKIDYRRKEVLDYSFIRMVIERYNPSMKSKK